MPSCSFLSFDKDFGSDAFILLFGGQRCAHLTLVAIRCRTPFATGASGLA